MNDTKDEFLMEIEQSHPPLPHNLNSQNTNHRAYFQSPTPAMHQISLTLLTDRLYRESLLTLHEPRSKRSVMIRLPISGSAQLRRTTGTLKIYRKGEQPQWQIVEVAASLRENRLAPDPPLLFSSCPRCKYSGGVG